MIKSVKLTNKYQNKNKQEIISNFVEEYSNVCLSIIQYIFQHGYQNQDGTVFNDSKKQYELETKLDNHFLKQFNNGHFTQRMMQACGTQASSIIRSCTVKQKRRKYVVSFLMKQNMQCMKLQRTVDKTKISVPNFKLIQPQIDNRFFDIQTTTKEFDGFIKLKLFKDKTINIPYKKHKRFLKWEEKGTLLNSLRISKDSISMSFEIPDVVKKESGETVGADQGITTCLTLSDNQITSKNNHGYDLKDIIKVICRRKKGSIGFCKAQQHRENYINWSLNQLNFSHVKQVNLERLFQVGKGTNQGTFLSSFTYPLIKRKLLFLSDSEGFTIKEVNNEFRSQRCSECGWTQKSNRRNKVVKCKHCGFATDADFNASLNLKEDGLPPVPKWVRLKKLNIKGFFWNLSGIISSSGENIVPRVQEINN